MELEAKLSAVCAAIEQLPLEHRTLLDQQLERESYLQRLQNIAEECSAENQLALKEQIEELEPRARELKETAQQLRGMLTELQQCVTQYDEETEHLSTDVLNVVQQHMDQLQQLLPDHRETLREVQEAAGEMETSLKECTELREEYAVWFDLDRRPLDAWLKAIEMPEYTNLKEVLNLKESRRVTVLTKQITSALQELDDGKSLRGSSNQRVHLLTPRYAEHLHLYGAEGREAQIFYHGAKTHRVGIPTDNKYTY